MKRIYYFTVLLLVIGAQVINGQTVVRSLAELRTAVQNNNQEIILEAGDYNIEVLDSNSRFFPCSGSNNTIDLTGVYIEFPVGSSSDAHFTITGSDNTLIGGTFENTYYNGMTEVTDYVAYNNDRDLARGGDPHIVIQGDKNTVIGTKMFIRGSFPYGYGSIYGINADNQFGLSKRGGIAVQGTNAVIDGCELQMQAFGHAIYIQSPSNHTIVRNTTVIGDVRSGAELLAETDSTSLPSRSDFQDFSEDHLNPDPILPETVYSLCEDGIRLYNGGGSMLVENCIVEKMRGGIRGYLGSGATVIDSRSVDCESTNFNLPSGGQITNSVGNFAYSPISDNRLGRSNTEMELTILPSPHASGLHNIADIIGNNQEIVFHKAEGEIYLNEDRAIVITGDNSTIINETAYKIILESSASGNTITSCGEVTDNGSDNRVTISTDCQDLQAECINEVGSLEAECNDDMFGIENQANNSGGISIAYIEDQDWIKFDSINLTGMNSLKAIASSENSGGAIEVHIDALNGDLLGTISVSNTTGWNSYETFSSKIAAVSGTHDVYFKFVGNTGFLFNLDWLGFDVNNILPAIEAVTGINISKENIFLQIGDSEQLIAEILPAVATNQNVSWETSNVNVATINSEGLITAISEGETTIIVTSEDGNFRAESIITVTEEIVVMTGISISTEELSLKIGESEQLIVEVFPTNATNQNMNWSSSDESIATVDANGVITTYAEGTVLITAASNDFMFTDTLTLTVFGEQLNDIKISEKVTLYPNPTNSVLLVNGALNATVEIYDVLGKLLFFKKMNSDLEEVDLYNLESAIYYVKIYDESQVYVKHIIKN